MKNKILSYVNEYVTGNDMMDYTEFELEDLIKDIANYVHANYINIWVSEISDGKYELHILKKCNLENEIETRAWDSKEDFANLVYELFQ